MARYSIEDTTLTAIGDALRRQHGETRINTIIEPTDTPVMLVSKTANATGFDSYNGAYEAIMKENVIRIPEASSIKVKMAYQMQKKVSYCYVQVVSGEYTYANFPTTATKYNSSTIENVELLFENTNVITFKEYFGMSENALGYYAECYALDENGEQIYVVNSREEEVPNTYSPLDMPAAIDDIGAVEPIVLSGDCSNACSGVLGERYIELFGDSITTENITNAENMFKAYKKDTIPFDINFSTNNTVSLYMMFYDSEIEELPKMSTCKISSIGYLFGDCRYLRTIPDDFYKDWDWSTMHTTSAHISYMFYDCFSLRTIPEQLLSNLSTKGTTANYVAYNSLANSCYALDEIKNLAVHQATLTSNRCGSMIGSCYRLKSFTFATNEDGTPKVASWKSQTIDLSTVGYTGLSASILNYNSGITADKEVKDDATYQALKGDPDWFTTKIEYSRYNHDSAVETINSLPDCSAYGTNTIKFKGAAGSATDGGAINTLTEEEIAVATAKGWTVSFA